MKDIEKYEVKKAPAVTEAENAKRVIKEFEEVIRNNNLDFREATSLFRWGRWNVFNDGFPTNEGNPTQTNR